MAFNLFNDALAQVFQRISIRIDITDTVCEFFFPRLSEIQMEKSLVPFVTSIWLHRYENRWSQWLPSANFHQFSEVMGHIRRGQNITY
jgi:hypothetical protein